MLLKPFCHIRAELCAAKFISIQFKRSRIFQVAPSVHVPCILLFKHDSVGYCLMVKVVCGVVRQRESDFFVHARLPSYPHTKGKEFNILYYLIVIV